MFFCLESYHLCYLGAHENLEPYEKPFQNIFENSPFSGQNRVKGGGAEFLFFIPFFYWNPPLFVT